MKNNLRTFLILAFLFLVGFVGFKIVRYSLARLTNSHQTKSFNLVTPKLSTDDLDTKDVQEIVKNYILDNPEVLLQSLENFQASRVEKQNEKIALKINAKRSELSDTSIFPSIGNQAADVKIIAFMDYACGYCQKSQLILNQLLTEDPKLLVIYHMSPILGESSKYLTKVALTVNKLAKDKFPQLNSLFLQNKIENKQDVAKILTDIGLKYSDIEEEMHLENAQKVMDKSLNLAKYLEASGVPLFIIKDKIYSGFLSKEQMLQIIKEARSTSSKP